MPSPAPPMRRPAGRGRRAVGAFALAAACGAGLAADPTPASASLCTPPQRVMFHCPLGAQAVSLCADMSDEAIEALDFRHGVPGRLEESHVARSADGRRFSATVSRIASRASVRQVWFSRGQLTYLLSECVGAGCARRAGFSVLRGGEVLSDQRCVRAAGAARTGFSPALAHFGADAADSRSRTPLLVFRNVELGIEALYPAR